MEYGSTLSLISTLDGGGIYNATPRPLFLREGDPVPILQEAGWTPRLVWTGTENLVPTGIRSSDRPARNESLYRYTIVYSIEWILRPGIE